MEDDKQKVADQHQNDDGKDVGDPNKASSRTIQVGNKIRRRGLYLKLKSEKKKEKRKRQDERKKRAEAMGEEAPPKLVPKTIDSMREYDETTVIKTKKDNLETREKLHQPVDSEGISNESSNVIEEEDEEVNWDLANDQFKDYFNKVYEPKVLITSADNPHSKTISFVKEMTRVIPNASPFWR